jgi:predicted XRE-type DNA-binding protein
MKIEVYQDVWDALEDDPVERERLKMRSRLMTALKVRIKSWHVTQAKAARRLGITQRRLNELLKDPIQQVQPGRAVRFSDTRGAQGEAVDRRDGKEEGREAGCVKVRLETSRPRITLL